MWSRDEAVNSKAKARVDDACANRLELVSALPLAFTPELTMLLLMVSGRRRRTHKIETSLVHMSRTHSGGLTLHQPQDRLH